jgi:rRNA-processing protein FCF1
MSGIIVDTSSILFGLSKKIDVFESIEGQLALKPVISKGVLRELLSISQKKGAYRKYAAAALALIEKRKPEIDGDTGYVDGWIASSARKYGSVCTNDTKLKRILNAVGIKTYSIAIGGKLK